MKCKIFVGKLLTMAFIVAFFTPSLMAKGKTEKIAGIGMAFGTSIQVHQNSNFKQGNGSYFRLLFEGDDEWAYFVHSEESQFNIEEGNCTASGRSNIEGIGVLIPAGPVQVSVLIGGANTATLAGVGTCTNGGIAATSSVDMVVDLGTALWTHQQGKVHMDLGLNYRHHKLSSPPTIKAGTETIDDLSGINLGIDVGYRF